MEFAVKSSVNTIKLVVDLLIGWPPGGFVHSFVGWLRLVSRSRGYVRVESFEAYNANSAII
jgi:hypothetical protein